MYRLRMHLLSMLLAVVFAASGALAQQDPDVDEVDTDDPMEDVGFRGWGPRAGASLSPDQFLVGAHVDLGNFAQRIRLQPNASLAFGDDITTFNLNFDASYRFEEDYGDWSPYVGGGFGAFAYSVRESDFNDDTELDFGFSILGGLEKGLRDGDRFFVEGKVGFADAPDFKIVAGWTFFE